MRIALLVLIVSLTWVCDCFGQDVDILRVGDTREKVESVLENHASRSVQLEVVGPDNKLAMPSDSLYSVHLPKENGYLMVFMEVKRDVVKSFSFRVQSEEAIKGLEPEDVGEQFVFTHRAENATVSVGDDIEGLEAKLRASPFIVQHFFLERKPDVKFQGLRCMRQSISGSEFKIETRHQILWGENTDSVAEIIVDGEPVESVDLVRLVPAFGSRMKNTKAIAGNRPNGSE